MQTATQGSQLPVRRPRLIHQTSPSYTSEALKAKVSGVVILKATVNEDGRATVTEVLRSPGHGLEESARREVEENWLFEPGYVGGRPVPVETFIEVSFHTKDSGGN